MTFAGIIESRIAIPDGVTVTMDGNTFKVKGPKGELSRNFSHPRVNVVVVDGEVVVSCEYPRIKDKGRATEWNQDTVNIEIIISEVE